MLETNTAHPAPLSRRHFLLITTAATAFMVVPQPSWALANSFNLDDFLALSEAQLEQTDLSKDFAERSLKAYIDMGDGDALATLLSGKPNQALANSIAATWYTGESPNPNDLQVLDYTDTLIWQAMDYTKPMGYCGGGVGYWADPPEEE